jgi:hypothetical protein
MSPVALLSHLRRAPDTDPDDIEVPQHPAPVVPACAVDDDFVDEHVETGPRGGSDGRLVRAKQRAADPTDANSRAVRRCLESKADLGIDGVVAGYAAEAASRFA